MPNINSVAQRVSDQMEQQTRREGDDNSKFWSLKNGHPDWMTNLCREAHGDMGPNDMSYEFIVEALDKIAEADDDATEDDYQELSQTLEPDIYNADLLSWIASNLTRAQYVEDAVSEFGMPEEFNFFNLLGLGQLMEKQAVFNSVLASLTAQAEEEADEEDEEPDDDEST